MLPKPALGRCCCWPDAGRWASGHPAALRPPTLAACPTRQRSCWPDAAAGAPCRAPQVPGHVQKFAGQHWRPEQLRSRFMNWLHEYKIQVRGMCGFD